MPYIKRKIFHFSSYAKAKRGSTMEDWKTNNKWVKYYDDDAEIRD